MSCKKCTRSCSKAQAPFTMVNGCPGAMGKIVTEICMKRGLRCVPFSLTGEDIKQDYCEVNGMTIKLLRPSQREAAIGEILEKYPGLICVDFTHPSAVNSNAEFYIRHRIPYVMGTTGGDREKMMRDVKNAGLYAVIAPNMAKQIVAFQAMIKFLADEFPGSFQDFKLDVVESHQKGKADTSGTAKAVVASFKQAGAEFDDNIRMLREPQQSMQELQVPEEYLRGHGFHTYTLRSADGTVMFQFKHNVCGRVTYAHGTADAVYFLANKIASNSSQRLFSMIDVLKSGVMTNVKAKL